ncbi:MAG: translation initiation factor IF-3 [Candidatus Krumholzibacteriota bacterium]|nr:translation initiation factor IF-3 [Candidatus Krumholzibacteriota bacterium]
MRVNNMINVPEVRVVDEDGNQMGVMSSEEALNRAKEWGMDLVEISPKAKPPVCKIIDYGKYKYEQNKNAHKAKKKQHVTRLKEIKLSTKIEKHDIDFKMRNAEKFFDKGDKVKFTIKFRGREMQHQEVGYELLESIKKRFEDICDVEKEPKRMGKTLSMTLVSVSDKKKSKKGEDDAEDKD